MRNPAKLIQIIGAIGILIPQYSCGINQDNRKNPYEPQEMDTCRSLIPLFEYPTQLNTLFDLNYRCNTLLFDELMDSQELEITVLFDDKFYSLAGYDANTRILIDKRNDIIFCFNRYRWTHRFDRKTIHRIYILDHEFMPEYVIVFHDELRDSMISFSGKTTVEKFDYDCSLKTLCSWVLKLQGDYQPDQRQLSYSEIVRIAKILRDGNYIQTDELISYSSPYFEKVPYWIEN